MNKLILFHNEKQIGTWTVGNTPFIIGSGDESDLKVKNPFMSVKHCMIVPAQDGNAIFDLNTNIGTFVNGNKIEKVLLKNGDTIDFGDDRIIFFDLTHKVHAEESQHLYAQTMAGNYMPTTAVAQRKWQLVVEVKKSSPITLPINSRICQIGSDPRCDIVLDGRKVSPFHAVMVFWDTNLGIINVSTKKKIEVNGAQVDTSEMVSVNDVITIGPHTITIQERL